VVPRVESLAMGSQFAHTHAHTHSRYVTIFLMHMLYIIYQNTERERVREREREVSSLAWLDLACPALHGSSLRCARVEVPATGSGFEHTHTLTHLNTKKQT
jgi:hypothetical protein